MTVKEFNDFYIHKFCKAVSFINCLDHALDKCDENTRKQLKIIGYDIETKNIIRNSLALLEASIRQDISYEKEKK